MKKFIKLSMAFVAIGFVSANVHASDEATNFTFEQKLVDAAEQNQVGIVKMLLNEKMDVDSTGRFETTALHRAAYNGYNDVAALLIEEGADVNAADFGGATPLHMAARKGNTMVVQQILDANANIDQQDNEGYSALHRAVNSDNINVVQLLLGAGSNPDNLNILANTPLIDAVRNNNSEIVANLISAGADKNIRNDKDFDAVDYALNVGSKELNEALSGKRISVAKASPLPLFDNNSLSINKSVNVKPINLAHIDGISDIRGGNMEAPKFLVMEANENIYDSNFSEIDNIEITEVNNLIKSSNNNVTINMPVVTTPKIEVLSEYKREKKPSPASYQVASTRDQFITPNYKKISQSGDATFPVGDVQVLRNVKSRSSASHNNDVPAFLSQGQNQVATKFNYANSNTSFKTQKTPTARKASANMVDYSKKNVSRLPASLRKKYNLENNVVSNNFEKVQTSQISPIMKVRQAEPRVEVSNIQLRNDAQLSNNTKSVTVKPISNLSGYGFNTVQAQAPSNIVIAEAKAEVRTPFTQTTQARQVKRDLITPPANTYNVDYEKLSYDNSKPNLGDVNYNSNNLVSSIEQYYNGSRPKSYEYNIANLQVERSNVLGIQQPKYLSDVSWKTPTPAPTRAVTNKSYQPRATATTSRSARKLPASMRYKAVNYSYNAPSAAVNTAPTQRVVAPTSDASFGGSSINKVMQDNQLLNWQKTSDTTNAIDYQKNVIQDSNSQNVDDLFNISASTTNQAKLINVPNDSIKVPTVDVKVSSIAPLQPIMPVADTALPPLPDFNKEEFDKTIAQDLKQNQVLQGQNIVVKTDNDLTGSHSIIGAFSNSDEALSYFNSISTRLVLAYNHKIVKDRNNKYYVAVGKLDDAETASKICDIYKSDYTTCTKSNATSTSSPSISKYQIVSNRKIYSLIGEFVTRDQAKNFLMSKAYNTGADYRIAKAENSDIYLVQLGPLTSAKQAKNLCSNYSNINNLICRVTVK